jgi:hypothetical protein
MSKKKEELLKEEIATQDAALATLPDVDFAADLETYRDEFDKSALQIPFLRILDAKSKTCTPGEVGYDEDARPGMFLNTVTGDLAKKIEVIPVWHYSTYIEWVPRSEGGGFVKDHGFDGGMKLLSTCSKRIIDGKESNRDMLTNGNDLIRTEVYFVLTVNEENQLGQAMITMTSTQLKKSRNWNSRFRLKVTEVPGQGKVTGAPMFFNTYRLSTQPEKNDFGNWMGYVIEDSRPTLSIPGAYAAAKAFRDTVQQGIEKGTISMKNAEPEGTTAQKEETPF